MAEAAERMRTPRERQPPEPSGWPPAKLQPVMRLAVRLTVQVQAPWRALALRRVAAPVWMRQPVASVAQRAPALTLPLVVLLVQPLAEPFAALALAPVRVRLLARGESPCGPPRQAMAASAR